MPNFFDEGADMADIPIRLVANMGLSTYSPDGFREESFPSRHLFRQPVRKENDNSEVKCPIYYLFILNCIISPHSNVFLNCLLSKDIVYLTKIIAKTKKISSVPSILCTTNDESFRTPQCL